MTKKQNFTLSLPYLLSQFSILRSAKCLWNNGRCLFWSGLLLVVGFELTEQKIKSRLFQEYALRNDVLACFQLSRMECCMIDF